MDFAFLDNDLFITKIVLACCVKENKDPVHSNRPSYGLAYHTAGKKCYTFASGEKLFVYADDVIFLPLHSYYSVETIENGDCYAINFLLTSEADLPPFVMHAKSKDTLLTAFTKAYSAFARQETGYSEKCCEALYGIIYQLKKSECNGQYASAAQNKIIDTAVSYIAENYLHGDITIGELCCVCGVSGTYLRKLFSGIYGMSPVEYINGLKLNYAKSLLSSGEYSVGDACFLSGFNDTSYFSRIFKKHFGAAPRDFSKSDFKD